MLGSADGLKLGGADGIVLGATLGVPGVTVGDPVAGAAVGPVDAQS